MNDVRTNMLSKSDFDAINEQLLGRATGFHIRQDSRAILDKFQNEIAFVIKKVWDEKR